MSKPGDDYSIPIAQAFVHGADVYAATSALEATPLDNTAGTGPSQDPYLHSPISRPPLQAQYSTDFIDKEELRRFLDTCQWPKGLQNTIIKCLKDTPYRFFICDDSGSMNSSDGNIFINGRKIQTTRWKELTESLQFHVQLAYHSRCPTEFRLLNGSNPIVVGQYDGDEDRVAILNALFDRSPDGGTPLCQHIRDVVKRLERLTPQLRQERRRASLVICTDGESSDGDVLAAMKPLQGMPVDVVVRLCTDENRIVEYWNGVDNQLELNLDILDDWESEAREVQNMNPFLNYCLPIHRFRESGINLKEFDLLDEAKLSPDHMRRVLQGVLGVRLPDPQLDIKVFCEQLNAALLESGSLFNPIQKKPMKVCSVSKVRSMYGKGGCSVS